MSRNRGLNILQNAINLCENRFVLLVGVLTVGGTVHPESAGAAPRVVLQATHAAALRVVKLVPSRMRSTS